MSTLQSFLNERFQSGGFTTEDALACFLPLMRQVVDAHAQGKVAPLEGLEALQVEGIQIWFEESRLATPKRCTAEARELDKPKTGAIEVIDEVRRTTDVNKGVDRVSNLQVGSREETITRPVYVPGYISWEHVMGCHDPLTDVFCLGLILASLSCGLDLNDPDDVEVFANNHKNLFAINSSLHPVLVKVIVRMTELSRHDRPQDLESLHRALSNYRDQETDIDLELLQIEGFEAKPLQHKQQIVLAKLQERLFEISRRNRLLNFHPTMQTVNLTHASVPLSFDIESIRPDRILTWSGDVKKDVLAESPISLNKYLNFSEALYLPSVLDRIRAEARRDEAEFGFVQLRLVLCFLKWADLKDTEKPRFTSPLVLLSVQLVKKKGVRDTYWLKPLDTQAEINPVLRYQFKQLYDIDLPETIDLTEVDVHDLHESLKAQIRTSEPAVSLERVDRPRIDLIHDLAKRRLDQYMRRVRLSGRGIRRFMDLDYSYDPANYHPLGIRVFNEMIRPSETHLARIIEDAPRAHHYVTPPKGGPVATKERRQYRIRDEESTNPYNWEFDLCSVTLGNFKYRKMSLVRDYAALLDRPVDNAAFDATFSLVPKPIEREAPQAIPLDDRYHVVPCDPTQTSAIALARSGGSYIIQGPPGTGKSQTITNLIADSIIRGKRVLFVCEKRAAIDVVYQRLKEQGLGDLACLIHDSQADKKSFVMDLKSTYESFLESQDRPPEHWRALRGAMIDTVQRELTPLQHFDESMRSSPEWAGISLHKLTRRAIELSEHAISMEATELELIPHHGTWVEHRDRIDRLTGSLTEMQPDGVLANHSLQLLSARLCELEHPLNEVTEMLTLAAPLLESLVQKAEDLGIGADRWESLKGLQSLVSHAVSLEALARLKLLTLLDENSDLSRSFDDLQETYREKRRAAEKANEDAARWHQRLSREEAEFALEQARALQGGIFWFLKPRWWRLRGVLNRCYDFKSHVVKPTWLHVIERLLKAYETSSAVDELTDQARARYGFETDLTTFVDEVEHARAASPGLVDWLQTVHETWIRSEDGNSHVLDLSSTSSDLERAFAALDSVLEDYKDMTPKQLRSDLIGIQNSLEELPHYLLCLNEIAHLPHELASVFRRHKLTPLQIEAATVQRSLDQALHGDRHVNRFSGVIRKKQVDKLRSSYQKWENLNAQSVRESVCTRFLESMRIASLHAAQLTAEQKDFKKHYNRGRREVEHEFGKSMRYKSIRVLAAGDSGLVVKDLKPVWLMSPLSVSDTLPLDADDFDVVIFDEASQITLEEAIPSIFRGKQAIVVGDEMQLPPTNFFSAKRSDDEDPVWLEEEGEAVEYDLSSSSFLNHAAKNLPARMLGWHYRSRSESLISFSNWAFYQGRLLTVPDERLGFAQRSEIRVTTSEAGGNGSAAVLDRPVSFHFVENGIYDKRRNRHEAEYIAHLVRGLLTGDSGRSIGIVAFSEAQQGEIEAALDRLGESDKAFRSRLDAELDREVDGQFVGLLVKNLENIQGDERDVIIMSVCYGNGPNGKMRMNFGPINQSGGEKRLNVAFSRAKHHMALVSSIRDSQITNDYNDGAACLKSYLRYAEACSRSDQSTARRVLREMATYRDEEGRPASATVDVVVAQLAKACKERGYHVDLGVGESRFRCDLALHHKGDENYRLGIMVDTDEYYEQTDLIERDLLKPSLLNNFGWRILHVLGKDWYEDSQRVLDRVERVLSGEGELAEDEADGNDLPGQAPPGVDRNGT